MTHCINSATISGNLSFKISALEHIYTRKGRGGSMAALGIVHTFRVCDRGPSGRASAHSTSSIEEHRCSTASPVLGVSWPFHFHQHDESRAVSHGGFSLSFPHEQWACSTFPIGYWPLVFPLVGFDCSYPWLIFLLGNFILSLAFLALCFFFFSINFLRSVYLVA